MLVVAAVPVKSRSVSPLSPGVAAGADVAVVVVVAAAVVHSLLPATT